MLNVVPFNKSHIDQAAEIESLSFAAPWNKRWLEYMMFGKNTEAVAIVDTSNNMLIGYASVDIKKKGATINCIAVHREHRRKGYGTAILKALMKIAYTNKCPIIDLKTETTNSIAIDLYKKHGFEKMSIVEDYYGQARDAQYMVAKLYGHVAE